VGYGDSFINVPKRQMRKGKVNGVIEPVALPVLGQQAEHLNEPVPGLGVSSQLQIHEARQAHQLRRVEELEPRRSWSFISTF